MKRQYYKIILITICLSSIVYILCFSWWLWDQKRLDKSDLAPNRYDIIATNRNKEYTMIDLSASKEQTLPFLIINSISFATDEQYLYIKYNLDGELPESTKDLPEINNNQVTSINYKLFLDENYFDLSGNKNPGGPEAELLISPYGSTTQTDSSKLNINGELLKGGPGFDYFVVRYAYYALLFNQIGDSVVFSSNSSAVTENYPDGIVLNHFENELLSAQPDLPREIKIDLSLKKSEGQSEENIRY